MNNSSNRQLKSIAQWLRVHAGRKSVEPKFANHLTEKGRALSDNYNLDFHSFQEGDGKEVNRLVV